MRKDRRNTLIVLCLSFAVVLGGWLLMQEFLEWQKDKFLNGTGQISLQSSATALLLESGQKETQIETMGQDYYSGESLPEDIMEKILNVWESGGRELPHEPRNGQIDMEQAIETGGIWVEKLVEQGVLPEKLTEGNYDKISAKLCTREAQIDFDEALLSYWSVQYIKRDITVSLLIHAICGEVWNARISMNEKDSFTNEFSEDELLEIAFPLIEKGDTVRVNPTDNVTYVSLKEGFVFAIISMRHIRLEEQVPVFELDLWLGTGKS